MPSTARKQTAPTPKAQNGVIVKDRTPLSALVANIEVLDDYEPAAGASGQDNPVYQTIKALLDSGKAATRVRVPAEERQRTISAFQAQANKFDKSARAYDEASEDNGKTAVIVFKLTDKITRTRKPAE